MRLAQEFTNSSLNWGKRADQLQEHTEHPTVGEQSVWMGEMELIPVPCRDVCSSGDGRKEILHPAATLDR